MAITDDIVKGLRNPTPLYAAAGTADLAAEKLREVPGLLDRLREQAPEKFGKLREQAPEKLGQLRATDPREVQQRVAEGAKDAQSKLNQTFSELDFKELRDLRKLGESVQGIALQGVGRAMGYAVRTRETYDELAERGKGAVAKWRGETADEVVEIAAAVEPDTNPAAEPAAKPAPSSGAAPTAKAKPAAAKPAAPRKSATPGRAAAKKSTDKPAG